MKKGCIIIIKDSTKKDLSDFRLRNEAAILSAFSKKRRFVSWDDVINYLFYLKRGGRK
jgi:hypothetical protein